MRSLILVALFLCASISASAQDAPAQPSPTPTPTPEPIASPTPSPAQEGIKNRDYFSLGVALSMANEGSAPYTIISGDVNATGDTTFITESAVTISAEAGRLPVNALGYNVGFAFDTMRDVEKVRFTGNGRTITGGTDGTQNFNVMNIYFNSVLAFERSHFFFGGNYSIFDYRTSGSISANGNIGLQGGAGIVINPHLAAEVSYRMITGKFKEHLDGTTIDYQIVYLRGFQVGLRYFF